MKNSSRTVLISLLTLASTGAAFAADAPAAAPTPAASASAPASGNATAAPARSTTPARRPFQASGKELTVGAAGPAIKVTNQDGKTVDLGEAYKTGYVLVYFYPKAFTGGCTAEACSLRDDFDDLAKEKLTIYGVSHDTVEDQKRFKDTYKLPFDLVSDPKGDVYTAFGVTTPTSRQSFLLKDGKVVWSDLQASTAQQAVDVKKALAASKTPAPAAPSTTAPAAK